jgi:hypothetical protein
LQIDYPAQNELRMAYWPLAVRESPAARRPIDPKGLSMQRGPQPMPSHPARSELGDALRACRGAFLGVGLMSCMINLLYLTGSFFMLEV